MKLTLRITAGSLMFMGSLFASVPAFDFTTSNQTASLGGSLSQVTSANDPTLKLLSAYAWTTTNTNATAAGEKLMKGYAATYAGYGLGVCGQNEVNAGACNTPNHQFDNNPSPASGVVGQYEFVLFQFSTPVDLKNVTLANYGSTSHLIDMDMSYWTGSSSSDPIAAGTSIKSLGSGWSAETTVQYAACSACSNPTVTDSLSGDGVSYLLIGAAYANSSDSTPDYFKIATLDANISHTPEPATFGLIGLGLAGLGLAAKRRKA